MTTKERILKFIEFKGISKRQFYNQCGLSNGALDKAENIGTDKVEKIYSAFPEINLVWLITGQGNMITEITSSPNTAESGLVKLEKRMNFIEQEINRLIKIVDIKRDVGK